MEGEPKQKVDLLPRCRLCLQWTEANDGLERYGDIFVENGDLSLKIRDCVGVFIGPDDSIRTVCANCQQTVRFIDDFRLLCRQTEEIYESVRVRCEDENKWDRYKACVDELRAQVQQHKDVVKGHLVDCEVAPEAAEQNSISNPFVPMMEVKDEMDFEEEYDPEQMVEQVVEIKPELDSDDEGREYDEDDDDDDTTIDLDITKLKSHRRIPIGLKLAIAQEVEKHPFIWDTTLAKSVRCKGKAWKEIGRKFNIDGTALRKNQWRALISFYRTKKIHRADQLEPDEKLREFMQIMQKITKGPSEVDDDDEDDKATPEQDKKESVIEETVPTGGSKKSTIFSLTTPSKRMQLAKLVYEHEFMWNRQHADFNAAYTKEEVWSQIAKQLKVTRDEVKYAWKCLRDLYRGRMKRVIKGELDRDARLLQDPLFKLLDRMFATNMRIGAVGSLALAQHKPESNDDTTEAAEGEESSAHYDQQDHSEGAIEEAIESTIEIKEEDVATKSAEPSSYELQLMFAREMLARINDPSNPKHDPAGLWKRTAEKLQLDQSVAKTRWNVMRANYKDNRRRIVTAGIMKRLRMQECELFNLMNQIIPKLEGSEPYVAPQANEKIIERQKLPIRYKIAIAEELKKNPEIWDTSLASSLQTIEKAWSAIASKFETDVITIRHHWKSLQNVYRFHNRREKEGGVPLRNNSNQKYRKLIALLRYMREPAENRGDAGETAEAEETGAEEEQESDDGEEDEVDEVDVECQLRDKAPKLAELALASDVKKMELAQFVHQHEFLWNHKHPDFGNLVLKDHTWDVAATTMKVTRDDIKYGWKCLRDLYRGRMKRVISGKLSSNASLLQDPLFQLLDVMCADNMKIGAHSAIPKGPATATAAGANESASNDAGDDREDEFSVKFDDPVKLKLIALVEQHELLWNSEHSEYLNLEKRDLVWDGIAEQMNVAKSTVKALWTRLRNIFRGRKLRLLKGLMQPNSPLLSEPIYVKLHSLLDAHMQLGKFTNVRHQLAQHTKPKATRPVQMAKVESGPFGTIDEKVRLVQEVMKHELLWNSNHEDYHRSDKRGAAWAQVAAMFANYQERDARKMWYRLRNHHRPRKAYARTGLKFVYSDDEEDGESSKGPLFGLFAKMAESLTVGDDSSEVPAKLGKRQLQEVTEKFMTHKCQYKKKKFFDDEGCIKEVKDGVVRYMKTCELCGKQVQRSLFEVHMNLHTGARPYACTYEGCDKTYPSTISRDKHERLVHRQDTFKFKCDQCDKKFSHRGKLTYHIAAHHQSQDIPCNICGKLMKHQKMLQNHIKLHFGHYPCKVCGKVLQKKYSLTVHMRAHNNELPFYCELCQKRFNSKVQLRTHLPNVHKRTWEHYAEQYGDSGRKYYFRSDLRGGAWRQIAAQLQNCEEHECKNMWRRLRNMHRPRKSRSVHQIPWKEHTNDDDDTEPIEAVNNPLYELFAQMARSLTGNEDSSQEAPKIGKRRLQEVTETFMTHKRRFTEKKYFDDEGCIKVKKGGSVRYEKVCELCGKQVERSMFEYHMNQHNGLKPYECSYPGCGRQYSNKVTRDRHELLIHCEDNYKYTCDQCEEKFKHRSAFNYHYAVKHQSQMVPCPICGKLLKHKSLIREHVRRHTGQFPCPVCDKILQKKYSLDVHMRTHTKEKPYFCELCSQRFMLKVQLKTHLSKVHAQTWEQYAASYGDSGGLQQ